MRICILTATSEFRVSRKSHFRDHSKSSDVSNELSIKDLIRSSDSSGSESRILHWIRPFNKSKKQVIHFTESGLLYRALDPNSDSGTRSVSSTNEKKVKAFSYSFMGEEVLYDSIFSVSSKKYHGNAEFFFA
jgi:hypothetical protein